MQSFAILCAELHPTLHEKLVMSIGISKMTFIH